MVSRPAAALVFVAGTLVACGHGPKDRAKIQDAITARLQRSAGLDLASLNVTTTSLTFDNNLAYATVAFHPKDDPKVSDGMIMKYTLEERDGKWVVVNVADSQGHGLAGHGGASSSSLPAGHPPVDAGGKK